MHAWYDRAFGPWYLKLYPHRNDAEAEAAVATVLPWLPETGRVLDAGCGNGRHIRILNRSHREVVGLDRSPHLLREAARLPGLEHRLVRGDMRKLPLAPGSFSAVLSMFTSFGYFGSPDAHIGVLREFARVSRPRGRLVLDYLNAERVRRNLVPRSERDIEGLHITERREIRAGTDGDLVVKEIVIHDAGGAELDRFLEEVALYDRNMVLDLLDHGGWRPLVEFGDYDGGSWTPESSRLLVIAETGRA